jgi:hypothetical protein
MGDIHVCQNTHFGLGLVDVYRTKDCPANVPRTDLVGQEIAIRQVTAGSTGHRVEASCISQLNAFLGGFPDRS